MSQRIVLLDSNTLFRQGLRALLSNHSEFKVMADVADGPAAYAAAVRYTPELVIMDLAPRGQTAMDFVATLKRRLPGTRVLVLTSHGSEERLREALLIGADGFALKDTTFNDLIGALRSVLGGNKYIAPEASAHLVEGYLHPSETKSRASPLAALTSRERSILQLIAEGRSNRTAAEALNVSAKTVEKHRANLMRKLGLRNSAELTDGRI